VIPLIEAIRLFTQSQVGDCQEPLHVQHTGFSIRMLLQFLYEGLHLGDGLLSKPTIE
jgi:hypothetical protein